MVCGKMWRPLELHCDIGGGEIESPDYYKNLLGFFKGEYVSLPLSPVIIEHILCPCSGFGSRTFERAS